MQILKLQEKNGDRYFKGNTPRQIHISSLKIVQERFVGGWYEDDFEAQEQAREIVETGDGARAFRFLRSRTNLDYEHFEQVTLEE